MAPLSAVECVTWNVHRGRGGDGRVDPGRVLDVLGREVCAHQPHILALQEADGETPPHAGIFDLARITAQTGLVYAHDTPALRWGDQSHGFLGAILFVHPSLRIVGADVIDLPGHCHRGAVVLELRNGAQPLRIITAHLSLSQILRIAQMRTLGQYLRRRPEMRTILLGDLNEWRPWGGLAFSRAIIGTRLGGPVRASFPVNRPLLPLDRILSNRPEQIRDLRVLDGPGIRAASDHRPLAGRVLLD